MNLAKRIFFFERGYQCSLGNIFFSNESCQLIICELAIQLENLNKDLFTLFRFVLIS